MQNCLDILPENRKEFVKMRMQGIELETFLHRDWDAAIDWVLDNLTWLARDGVIVIKPCNENGLMIHITYSLGIAVYTCDDIWHQVHTLYKDLHDE